MIKHSATLYCFSPPVMVATMLAEIVLAVYVFIRHRMTRFGKVTGLVLVLLATFQFAEYRICTTVGGAVQLWSRIGFIAITLLPIAGLYLVSLVSHKQHFLKIGYASAAAFIVYFILVPKSISSASCSGNYVLFSGPTEFYRLYGLYYWGFLLLGIWESIEKIESLNRLSKLRSLLQWLIIGYLSFMAPMSAAYLLFPQTRSAVASIMCGFAVTMAFLYALKIVPAYERTHRWLWHS